MTRSMGRRESDSSPIISTGECLPGTMPLSMRMVDPELPQSSGAAGADSASPRPCTSITFHRLTIPRHPERAHAAQRAGAIGAGGIVFKARTAFGDSRQHGVAMGDRLVSGELDAAANIARRAHDGF